MTPTFQSLSPKEKFASLIVAGFFYVWDRHLLYRMTHGDWLTRKTWAAEWLHTREWLKEWEKEQK